MKPLWHFTNLHAGKIERLSHAPGLSARWIWRVLAGMSVMLAVTLLSPVPHSLQVMASMQHTRGAGLLNPATVYCVDLGYQHIVVDTPEGQQGRCLFPDGTQCEAWAFLQGECGGDKSWCAKNGYAIETRQNGEDPFSSSYAVCIAAQGTADAQSQVIGTVTALSGLDVKAGKPKGMHPGLMLPPAKDVQPESTLPASGTVPDHWDWRNYQGANWMTPVKNQNSCGSCWAFGAIGAVEANYNLATNNPDLDLDLAEQDLVSCSGAGTCSGGVPQYALEYMKDMGVVDEKCMPYTASDLSCNNRCSDYPSRLVKVHSTESTYTSDRLEIQRQLVQHGPLAVTIPCINHVMVLVGYDNTDRYWIFKNSWGTGYEDGGYPYAGFDSCWGSITAMATAVPDVQPKLIAPPDASSIPATAVQKFSSEMPMFLWEGQTPDYRVMVSTDPSVANPILSSTVHQPSYTPETPLAPGTYYWAVAPLTGDGQAGEPSPVRTFTIYTNMPGVRGWLGTLQVSYMGNSMHGGGASGLGNPVNLDPYGQPVNQTYCGNTTAPIDFGPLEAGLYKATLIHGARFGKANPACTAGGLLESETLANFWYWVRQKNVLAQLPGTGFDAGTVTAFPGNPDPGWFPMAEIWVGPSVQAGARHHIESFDGLQKSRVLPAGLGDHAWFYLWDWVNTDNLGGVTVEFGKVYAGTDYVVNTIEDTVDSSPGDGACMDANDLCSLRAAIMESNAYPGEHNITFMIPGPGPHTITLSNNLPEINDHVAIAGYDIVIDGNNHRIFRVGSGTLNLYFLTLVNGDAPQYSGGGGALQNYGAVKLNSVNFRNNKAMRGGAILNWGSLYGWDVVVEGNQVEPGFQEGGGIHNRGVMTLSYGTVVSNTAAYGGGIYNVGTLTSINTSFHDNTASAGGAIFNEPNAVLRLNFVTMTGNKAETGNGGAVYNLGNDVLVQHSTFTGNQSTPSMKGGAMANASPASAMHIFASTFAQNNSAILNEGAMEIAGTQVISNQGYDNGAGIHNTGVLTLTYSNVISNGGAINSAGVWNEGTMLIQHSTIAGNYGQRRGGGIFNTGDLTLDSSAVTNNEVARISSGHGGGLLNENGRVNIINSTISENRNHWVTNGGGGILTTGPLTLTASTVQRNDPVGVDTAFVYGTGVVTATIQQSIIESNVADFHGALQSAGYNRIGIVPAGSTFINALGDQAGTPAAPLNVMLGPLTDNGGGTKTHALLPGSPAIDAVPPNACAVVMDQRGVSRPQGVGCDAGAYEYNDFRALEVHVVGNGAVVKTPDQPSYVPGTTVTLSAVPAATWVFGGWSGDASGMDNPAVITMDTAKSITATFNCAPITGLKIEASEVNPRVGHAVTFTATQAGGSLPISYIWQWGDGISTTVTLASITHEFPLLNVHQTYSVSLAAANVCGAAPVVVQPITVHPYEQFLPYLLRK